MYISFILCVSLITNTVAFAAEIQPQAVVDSITIENRSGVLAGETIQLTATIESNGSFLSGVKWSSSNPEAISCTEDGKIKGITAGKSAVITCKAKWGSAEDTIKVYCVEKISQKVKSGFKNILTFVFAGPNLLVKDICFDIQVYRNIFINLLRLLSIPTAAKTSSEVFLGDKVTVYGKAGGMAYVRYGEGEKLDGFVRYIDLKNQINAFLNLSTKNMNVWANGITYEGRNLTTSYKGTVDWTVENNKYISFDEETGQITGKTEGIGKKVKITAKADGMTESCTIHLLYKWEQPWTTKTNKETYLYNADENTYVKGNFLAKGKEFVVQGDCGTSSGWAYGYCKINGENRWGYVPIADVSTKGTVSQYNNLTTTIIENGKEKAVPWFWPVRDVKNGVTQTTKARYITSPYGWRDDDPIRHKGIDITNGISSKENLAKSADGYEVVSAFAGTVIYTYDVSLGYKSCGNCVAIRSNEKDPVTGKHYVAIYMHLKSKPVVKRNQKVSASTLLGYVGNTGNSAGSHLHFEVNNQNLSYGEKIYYESNSEKEMYFGSVINPLFFYMNYYNLPEGDSGKIKINPTCDAMNYRKPLWYGDDIKESKYP